MRAAILNAFNEPLVIEEISTPAMGPHDVLLHIDASGVCQPGGPTVCGGCAAPTATGVAAVPDEWTER